MVHTPFFRTGYCSPCAPLVYNPVKAPDIRFSSSQFRKQHPRHEKAVSRTSLARLYTRGRVRALREGGRAHPTLGHTKAF
ncbi:unnamed protein product, partial [Schistosoma mattheei]